MRPAGVATLRPAAARSGIMNTKVIGLVLLLAAVAAGLIGLFRNSGELAPDAQVTTITGEKIALRELHGHPVLVAFWATDCRGCIEEIPDLAALHDEFGARGLAVIAVAMPYDMPSRVVEMARAKRLPYKVALDPAGQATAAFGGVELVPNSFLIGRDGRIMRHSLGRLRAGELRPEIEHLLGES